MSDSPSVRNKLKGLCDCVIKCFWCFFCSVFFYFGPAGVVLIRQNVEGVLSVLTVVLYFIILITCGIIGCVICHSKGLCCCCSEDVPSQETARVECPRPVQRDEQTAVTIELEEKGGPTAKLGTPSPAEATPPPDKPETQGAAVPPSYQVHIQPRWLGNHCKGISNPVYRLLMANWCMQI